VKLSTLLTGAPVASKAAILHVAADFATACTAALETKELLGTNAVTAGAPAAATSASKHGAFMLLCDLDHRKTLFKEPQIGRWRPKLSLLKNSLLKLTCLSKLAACAHSSTPRLQQEGSSISRHACCEHSSHSNLCKPLYLGQSAVLYPSSK
jgi:cytochrome c5